MGRVIHAEWTRGIRSWRFWLGAAITLGLLLFTAIQYAQPWIPRTAIPRFINFYGVSLMALGAYITAVWPVLMPVVAVLPAGDSLAIDRRRGLDALLIARVGWTRYLWGKLVGNALLVVAEVGVAILAAEALLAGILPIGLPPMAAWTFNPTRKLPHDGRGGVIGSTYVTTFHSHFLWAAPSLYLLAVCLVALWAAVALAGLSTAAGVWIRQPLLALAVPMVVAVGGDVVSQAMWHGTLVPSVYAGAYMWYYQPAGPGSFAGLGLYWAAVAAVPVLVIAWLLWRRREWPRSVG